MFFRVRGRRAHTSTYVTEPETRRKGARCALMFGLAPPRGFAPLAHPLPYLAQLRLGILVPSDFPLAALSRPGGSMTHCVIDYSARSNPHISYIKTNKKTRIMRVFFNKPNRTEGLQIVFFRVRGRRAHTSTYVTEPETRRKGARCALMFGLAPPRGFEPLIPA